LAVLPFWGSWGEASRRPREGEGPPEPVGAPDSGSAGASSSLRSGFPKTHRFVLADKLEHEALESLLVLINARYSKRRRATARSQFGLQSRSARAERPPRRE